MVPDPSGGVFRPAHRGGSDAFDAFKRPIGEWNCTHIASPIVLGVSKRRYTDAQLAAWAKKNEKGIELDGKHYSIYEASQLMRQIETQIREQKDIANVGKITGDDLMRRQAQKNISNLNIKYREISEKSGLATKAERLRVVNPLKTAGSRGILQASGQLGDTNGYSTITAVRQIDARNAEAVKAELDSFAEKYRVADIEHSLVISPSGKVYEVEGTHGTVDTSLVGTDILEGSTVMHNHPVWEGFESGDSFSKEDLGFAAEYKTGAQYLISGERFDSFLYEGELIPEGIYAAYKEAKNFVLQQACDKGLLIEYEQEEVMKVLNGSLEGFKFYADL